jgi:hypothetical protein
VGILLRNEKKVINKSNRFEIHFDGIFQDRLATDLDSFDNPRGEQGWTKAHGGETDFDRIIRFNNPLSTRNYIDKVGVFITNVSFNGTNISDSLVGKMINLGPNTQFVGSPNVGGREVLMNFELYIGDSNVYFYGLSSKTPFNSKFEINSQIAKNKLGIHSEDDMDNFVNNRIKLLNSISNHHEDTIDKERLDNIDNSLWVNTPWNERPLLMLMNFRFPIDQNVQLNPQDSEVIRIIQDSNIQDIIFDVNFYSYDGDGLIGHVTGHLEGQLIDN